MRALSFPRRGEKYTFAQIRKLPLRDQPFLCVEYNDDWLPIQSQYATDDEISALPGFDDTKWCFIVETDEWIPVFHYCGDADVFQYLVVNANNCECEDMVYFKGFEPDYSQP